MSENDELVERIWTMIQFVNSEGAYSATYITGLVERIITLVRADEQRRIAAALLSTDVAEEVEADMPQLCDESGMEIFMPAMIHRAIHAALTAIGLGEDDV